MRPASPERGFPTATTAMFGQMQTLMLHLFTATNNALWSTFGRALLMTFLLGLTCYADGTMHRFSLCFWRKSYQKCLTKSHCQSGETWFQYNTAAAHFACQVQEHLTITYNDRWIAQCGPMAWPPRSPDLIPMDFFVWGHTKALISTSPVDSEAFLLPVLLRQQQPSGSNVAFLSVHVILCFIIVSCVLRSVAVCLNICSELGQNTTFFSPPQEYFSGVA